jgi:hypothetical protein
MSDELKVIDEVYEMAKDDASAEVMRAAVRSVGRSAETIGALKMLDYQAKQGRLMKLAMLYRVKQDKAYQSYGTWSDYCQAAGENVRTVDRALDDMAVIFDEVKHQGAALIGLDMSRLRWLGKNLDATGAEVEDGAIVAGGRRIPISAEHGDEIAALIDELKDAQRLLIEEKDRQIEEKAAEVKAAKKAGKSYRDTIDRQARELSRYENRPEDARMDAADETFQKKIADARRLVEGIGLQFSPENDRLFPTPDGQPSRLMKSEYLSGLDYMARTLTALLDDATAEYGAMTSDAGGWTQPEEPKASAADTPSPSTGEGRGGGESRLTVAADVDVENLEPDEGSVAETNTPRPGAPIPIRQRGKEAP